MAVPSVHLAYSVMLAVTVSRSKSQGRVMSKSVYQPSSTKPSLVGSSGRVTYCPRLTTCSGTKEPPLLSNFTVQSSVTTTVTSRASAA